MVSQALKTEKSRDLSTFSHCSIWIFCFYRNDGFNAIGEAVGIDHVGKDR